MFRLSRAAEYSIRGVLYLAGKGEGEIAGIEEIARATDVPSAYLAKLFQTLGKHGFVRSIRGPEGGFTLTKLPEEISVLEVIEAIEGPIFFNECLIHEGSCPRDKHCPVHVMWKQAQESFLKHLRNCNFKELVRKGLDRDPPSTLSSPPPGEWPGNGI